MKPHWRVRWWQTAAVFGALLIVLTVVSHATRGGKVTTDSPVAAQSLPAQSTAPAATKPIARKPPTRGAASHGPGKHRHHSGVIATERSPGHGIILPNRTATPGAINRKVTQANIYATICVAGYTARIRPSSSYTTAIKIAQLHRGYTFGGDISTGDYEEDHLISLELGGSPTSRKNLWPEPYGARRGARVKDVVENKLHELVCGGVIRLRTAQQAIATSWWKAYRRYVPSSPAPTTSAPTTSTPPPPPSTTHSSPPPPVQHACTTTSSGTCIQGGEFCPQADYGQTGYDADGTPYTCTGDTTHPHWE